MIKLKKMRWSHMFSYGPDNEIDFEQSRLTQLVGKNGYGKTTIGLILEEILFNKNSKGTKKSAVLNRYTSSKVYYGELDFSIGEDEFNVQMRRGSSQVVVLLKNGVDISSHTSTATYKQLEALLGMDHKTFTQIVSQSSASSLEFLTTTDTQRKKFLIDLLDQSHYLAAGEHFKNRLKELDTAVKVAEGKLDVVNKWIENSSKLDRSLIELVEVPLPDPGLRLKVADISATIATLALKNREITQNNTYKKVLDSIVIPTKVEKPDETLKVKYQNEVAHAEYKLAEQRKIIARLSKLGATCPTCDSHLDVAKIKAIVDAAQVEEANAELDRSKAAGSLTKINKLLSEWAALASATEKFETYHSLYNPNIPSTVLDASALESERKALEAEITKQQNLITSATAHNASATKHNSRIELVIEQEGVHKLEHAQLTSLLSSLRKQKTQYEVLAKTFSTSGLVAYKIECLVKDLEDLTNQYLAELSDGRFQLSFQISGSDKLNVVIVDNGVDIEIVELSNGERARVNMAALLGIRKLLQSTSNNRINLLFLDEVIENLDTDGKERLVEVLLAEADLNTILVSHGFSHPLLEKVQVVKENNISRIE